MVSGINKDHQLAGKHLEHQQQGHKPLEHNQGRVPLPVRYNPDTTVAAKHNHTMAKHTTAAMALLRKRLQCQTHAAMKCVNTRQGLKVVVLENCFRYRIKSAKEEV